MRAVCDIDISSERPSPGCVMHAASGICKRHPVTYRLRIGIVVFLAGNLISEQRGILFLIQKHKRSLRCVIGFIHCSGYTVSLVSHLTIDVYPDMLPAQIRLDVILSESVVVIRRCIRRNTVYRLPGRNRPAVQFVGQLRYFC